MDASVNQGNEAVNTQAAPESAPEATQANVQTPPVEGNPTEQRHEQAIPYSRFAEVNERMKAAEARLKEIQSPRVDPTHSEMEAAVKNYVDAGLTEQAARVLVNNQLRLVQSQQAELKAELHGYKLNQWTQELKESYKDYAEVSAEADKQFADLSPEEKADITRSRRNLQNFFKSVRADLLEKKLEKSFNDGASHAYQNKQIKQGMGSVPGKTPVAASQGGITREELRRLASDPDAYRKRLPEINEALARGLIK